MGRAQQMLMEFWAESLKKDRRNTYGENCEGSPLYAKVPPPGYDYKSWPRITTVANGITLTARCWATANGQQQRHKTSVDWVRHMMKQARRWLPGRRLVFTNGSTKHARRVMAGLAGVGVDLHRREP